MSVRRVALLTAGGFAPCLSSAVGGLIGRYTEVAPEVEIIAYEHGYWGLLQGKKIVVSDAVREKAGVLHEFGGSPIGNSRVKLTNVEDCVKRGLVKEGQDPLAVAAEQLKADGVDVLHTIGGDDTNTTAADLAAYLHDNGYELTVVGLPKTIDNDVVPIKQSLGAWSAAEQASVFAQNVIGEHRSGPRMLIIHEVMGRACGWLTAASGMSYRKWLDTLEFVPEIGLSRERWDIHALYVPEQSIDLDAEADRLKVVMDTIGNVNIFLSEGAGVPEIIKEIEESGGEVARDPFGHVRLGRHQPRRMVRQAVCRAPRSRESDGPEVGLLLAFRSRQRPRPATHQVDDRLRRRVGPARRIRRGGARRGGWRPSQGDRFPAHRGPQAFRHHHALVRRPVG